jgi:hypothetical protein
MNAMRIIPLLLILAVPAVWTRADQSGFPVGEEKSESPLSSPEESTDFSFGDLVDRVFFTLFGVENPIGDDGLMLLKEERVFGSRYTFEIQVQTDIEDYGDLSGLDDWRELLSDIRFSMQTPIP